MVAKRSANTITQPPVEKVGLCIQCIHGYVMSDGIKGNPLIIECDIDHSRYPQSWLCRISSFVRNLKPMEIHEMIYLNRESK